MKISNPALHTKVQNWAQDQGIDKPVHDLSLRQLQQAGRAVGADLGELVKLREELVSNAAEQAMDAGQATAADRDAAQGGMPMGMGGAQNVGSSPLFIRGNFDAKAGAAEIPGDLAEAKAAAANDAYNMKGGKGVGFGDTDAAMGSFATRYSSKSKNVKYDGYKGGSSDIDAFYTSGYSISDAEALLDKYPAGYINNLWEAKELIGAKASSGFTGVLNDYGITTAPFDKHEQLDAFANSDYTDYDARLAVATFPFLHDVEGAKEYIGLKVINGTEDILSNEGIGGAGERHMVDLYFKSGYDFDDVETVMREFHVSDYTQAKGYIGQKIARGREDILVGIGVKPHDSNYEAELAFYKSGYTAEDAKALANAHGMDLGDAEVLIGEKLLAGNTSGLDNLGITQFSDKHDGLAAFHRSPYTEADARMLLVMTSFLDTVDDARAYIGHKINNGAEGYLKDLGITRSPFDDHDQLRAFANSDYTGDDVDAAVERFSFLSNPDEARQYIGLKVMNGTEDILHERGIGVPGKGDYMPKGGYNPKGGFYAGKGYYAGFKK